MPFGEAQSKQHGQSQAVARRSRPQSARRARKSMTRRVLADLESSGERVTLSRSGVQHRRATQRPQSATVARTSLHSFNAVGDGGLGTAPAPLAATFAAGGLSEHRHRTALAARRADRETPFLRSFSSIEGVRVHCRHQYPLLFFGLGCWVVEVLDLGGVRVCGLPAMNWFSDGLSVRASGSLVKRTKARDEDNGDPPTSHHEVFHTTSPSSSPQTPELSTYRRPLKRWCHPAFGACSQCSPPPSGTRPSCARSGAARSSVSTFSRFKSPWCVGSRRTCQSRCPFRLDAQRCVGGGATLIKRQGQQVNTWRLHAGR